MAFVLGALVGAAAVLIVIGLAFLLKYDAYKKGYFDGTEDSKNVMETKIFMLRDDDDRK